MYVGVECVSCGEMNVVDVCYIVQNGEFVVEDTQSFDEFYAKYCRFVMELPEFPIMKDHLIKLIRKALNVSTALAYDILERIKKDLGLYEQNGIIYEA